MKGLIITEECYNNECEDCPGGHGIPGSPHSDACECDCHSEEEEECIGERN